MSIRCTPFTDLAKVKVICTTTLKLFGAAYHPKRKTEIHIYHLFLLRVQNDNKRIKRDKYSTTTETNRS